MFIEYEIYVKNERHERGVFNTDYVMSVEIEQHGGGYGKAINILYANRHEVSCIFILDNDDLLNKVYFALINSLRGHYTRFDGIELTGHIKPVFNPHQSDAPMD